MAAAYFPRQINNIASRARKGLLFPTILFTLTSAFMSAITYFVLSRGIDSVIIGVVMGIADLGLGFLGILVGIKVINTLVPKFKGFPFVFGSIGRNTLPIYVLHLPLLART